MVGIKTKVFGVLLSVATVASAQTNTVAQLFAEQMAPVLDSISALKPNDKYSPQTTAALEKLLQLAKSDAEVAEVTFLQQDLSGYLSMEKKPTDTARRKQCLAAMKAGNVAGSYDRSKSKACEAITNAIYP